MRRRPAGRAEIAVVTDARCSYCPIDDTSIQCIFWVRWVLRYPTLHRAKTFLIWVRNAVAA